MSEIDTSTLVLYRSLSNGGYLMRTPGDGPWRLVLYSPHGQVIGEVVLFAEDRLCSRGAAPRKLVEPAPRRPGGRVSQP